MTHYLPGGTIHRMPTVLQIYATIFVFIYQKLSPPQMALIASKAPFHDNRLLGGASAVLSSHRMAQATIEEPFILLIIFHRRL